MSIESDVRSGCQGIVPLPARLEAWQLSVCRRATELASLIDRHGSPLNLIDPSPMARNAEELAAAAVAGGVDLGIFFARKANKALALVDEALRLGLGVDVASERELEQTLSRGAAPSAIVVTAAVKPRALLELCAARGPTVVLDNEDELIGLGAAAEHAATRVPVALRLAPAQCVGAVSRTRFGLPAGDLLALVDRHWPPSSQTPLPIAGIHFHVDGYDPDARIRALGESIGLIDGLRARGHQPAFVDIGGGIPMSYLDDSGAWDHFWAEHRSALRGDRAPLTYDGHGLGLTNCGGGEIAGQPAVYPSYQRPTRTAWLSRILAAPAPTGGSTIAGALAGRSLELRCEPGRSLVDGCGVTAARVEFRKQRADGTWLIGLAMNRTQCRSTADDFLVDPLLVRPSGLLRPAGARVTGPIEGFLVGAYCIERELLTWRRLRFPAGVELGDLVVFPNTAGYLMHILESASHQIPLARNVVLGGAGRAFLDPIDDVDSAAATRRAWAPRPTTSR